MRITVKTGDKEIGITQDVEELRIETVEPETFKFSRELLQNLIDKAKGSDCHYAETPFLKLVFEHGCITITTP